MIEPVKGSLLENLLEDWKILEVKRRKPLSTHLKGLGEGILREWVVRETLSTSL
jgi:hypothetical protein